MNTEQLSACFERHQDEFLKFERVDRPPSKRRDICAFLLLEQRYPGKTDMVTAAEHDQIWLDPSGDQLADITEDDVVYLARCGVMWDNDTDSLSMFA